ncbi:MAG: hypothetical protein P4L44_04845 [Oryzomonas sp.]|uniref:hypothetical protein n=1 Tax=Oryzomonas sp. TaxID=2855186 RepID=UPI00283EB38A|nr:hypothetical protein [Oryzomonas sp.]MDR3579273.1 hypothetical protein [Oryzomonas sp.]
MTTDNKNHDFTFGSITKTVEKSDKDGIDDFDFGDLSWPVEKTGQDVSADFSFDALPEPVEKSDQAGAELSPAKAPVKEVLPFTCLKCAATNEVGFNQISDDGLIIKCSSCRTRIEIVRDSCAKRASQLSRELFCVKCGHQLDHHLVCRSCGLLYPDYFVVVNHEEARRQAKSRRSAKFRQAFVDFGASFGPGPSKVKQGVYSPDSVVDVATWKPAVLSSGLRKALVGSVVVVVIAAGGFFYYRQYRAEQEFVKNYVKALYGIKVGVEGSLNACAKISEDWKATADSRVNFTPRVNMDADVKAERVKSEVDRIMQTLQNPPAKYSQAKEKLAELNNIYANLYSFKSSPRGTLDSFKSSTNKAGLGFQKAAEELKASLPEKLSKELEIAKQRYRGLASL